MKALIKININYILLIHLVVLFSIFHIPILSGNSNIKLSIKDSTLSKHLINKIDSIAQDGIKNKAYPGCQIVILINGKKALQKSYGYQTYQTPSSKLQTPNIKVQDTNLYDLASLTKVAATTLCIMKLVDEDKIKIDDKLSRYLPYLMKTNKENITIREVMAHQAGLKAWIPFYKSTLTKDNKLRKDIYSDKKVPGFAVQVTEDLYIKDNYRDTIYKQIIDSPLGNKKYIYSDLGFYLLADIIKQITGKGINEYAKEKFYKPMGLKRITYLPLNKFPLSEIVPTENDTAFRKQLIHGYVHDPGAAMLGGISGHAGLFSDALDLAQLFQMLLDDGKYRGTTMINSSTVKEFTKCQYPQNGNRRGLGFDKPLLSNNKFQIPNNKQIPNNNSQITNNNGPCCEDASDESFGHSGFTGTYVWADPKYKLVYVFLSNRIYPDVNNHKITEMNIRTNIQQVIYDCLEKR